MAEPKPMLAIDLSAPERAEAIFEALLVADRFLRRRAKEYAWTRAYLPFCAARGYLFASGTKSHISSLVIAGPTREALLKTEGIYLMPHVFSEKDADIVYVAFAASARPRPSVKSRGLRALATIAPLIWKSWGISRIGFFRSFRGDSRLHIRELVRRG